MLSEAGGLRVEARLVNVDGVLGPKLWVETFAGELTELDGLERRIAIATAAAIAAAPPS